VSTTESVVCDSWHTTVVNINKCMISTGGFEEYWGKTAFPSCVNPLYIASIHLLCAGCISSVQPQPGRRWASSPWTQQVLVYKAVWQLLSSDNGEAEIKYTNNYQQRIHQLCHCYTK